jgi:hypothetical protein
VADMAGIPMVVAVVEATATAHPPVPGQSSRLAIGTAKRAVATTLPPRPHATAAGNPSLEEPGNAGWVPTPPLEEEFAVD